MFHCHQSGQKKIRNVWKFKAKLWLLWLNKKINTTFLHLESVDPQPASSWLNVAPIIYYLPAILRYRSSGWLHWMLAIHFFKLTLSWDGKSSFFLWWPFFVILFVSFSQENKRSISWVEEIIFHDSYNNQANCQWVIKLTMIRTLSNVGMFSLVISNDL